MYHVVLISAIRQSDSSIYVCVYSAPQLCLTLCDPMDCSPPGSSIHGIFQAVNFSLTLEWVAISFARWSFPLRDWTHVSCIFCTAGRFFTHCTTCTHLPSEHPQHPPKVILLYSFLTPLLFILPRAVMVRCLTCSPYNTTLWVNSPGFSHYS